MVGRRTRSGQERRGGGGSTAGGRPGIGTVAVSDRLGSSLEWPKLTTKLSVGMTAAMKTLRPGCDVRGAGRKPLCAAKHRRRRVSLRDLQQQIEDQPPSSRSPRWLCPSTSFTSSIDREEILTLWSKVWVLDRAPSPKDHALHRGSHGITGTHHHSCEKLNTSCLSDNLSGELW